MQPAFASSLQTFPEVPDLTVYGNGRSYGDVCLNNNGHLCDMRALNRIISFDRQSGLIECQAGMLLRDLLSMIVPAGYFVPVSPGTSFVTLGGMVANDVHGKNHHVKGSFGRHVVEVSLLRSEQGIVHCSAKQNSALFYATLGGLGLTGIILSMKIKLLPVCSACIHARQHLTVGLDEQLHCFDDTDKESDYTVSWLDLHRQDVPGIFSAGGHADTERHCQSKSGSLRIPFTAPNWLLNATSNRLFNRLYWYKNRLQKTVIQDYSSFFYPLDGLADWNRLYGRRGFYQYQFVVPTDAIRSVFHDVLRISRRFTQLSYLTVLKKFGELPSPGLLSFARPGYTLAMDFPNKGASTLAMFREFDAVIQDAQGAIYPAKDARMSASMFRHSFPRYEEFEQYRDKLLISDFWRRVTE